MKRYWLNRFAVPASVLLLLAGLTGMPSMRAAEPDTRLEITEAWVRAMPPGTAVAAGYLRLHNAGSKDIRVVGLSSPQARAVEIHSMTTEDGLMRMRQLQGLGIAAGETAELSPEGSHLMFIGVTTPVSAGTDMAVTLLLADGSTLDTRLPVLESAPEAARRVAGP